MINSRQWSFKTEKLSAYPKPVRWKGFHMRLVYIGPDRLNPLKMTVIYPAGNFRSAGQFGKFKQWAAPGKNEWIAMLLPASDVPRSSDPSVSNPDGVK
ncbi:hypothetical protein CRP01_31110 [Flavilitoribacter nigricans DSM 23189 = NBRC 102662]|uniref:Uncharacterized protein n=1 Tax=Flavilitoribacter nigricans (strain ATCC 23147 / DSM 23189 / NBRC 102662 / NCIMB 1420 / SS-2) TaxID=1122177 RepID=A0A2D0N2B9_FLAN2|nr:hypothetical protein CRP01_31110 [Flavilitoribacter nigricans DSM 23189 = NBRC 102662]